MVQYERDTQTHRLDKAVLDWQIPNINPEDDAISITRVTSVQNAKEGKDANRDTR